MNNYVRVLVENIECIFKKNLLCVLLLGSVQKGDTTPFSDIDLIAVIKEFNLDGLTQTRNLIRQSEVLVDLSFICWNELSQDPNKFSFGTHGCYQLGLILNKAKCLSGRNVLLELGMPEEENIRYSLLQKIIQYTWWMRRMFVESNRERSLKDNYQINSRLIKVIRGLLYLKKGYNIHATAENAVKDFVKIFFLYFSDDEKVVLSELADRKLIAKNTANMSENFFSIRLSLINKMHKIAIRLM